MEWLRECCLQRSIRQVACPCRSSARRLRLDVGRERGLYLVIFSLKEFAFSRNDLRSTPSLKTWCIAVRLMVVVVLGKIAFRRQCAGPRHFDHFLWYKQKYLRAWQQPGAVSWWHVYSMVGRKVMGYRRTRQNIKYISCFGSIVLHRKNSLSLLCDARSTALTNRLRHECNIY